MFWPQPTTAQNAIQNIVKLNRWNADGFSFHFLCSIVLRYLVCLCLCALECNFFCYKHLAAGANCERHMTLQCIWRKVEVVYCGMDQRHRRQIQTKSSWKCGGTCIPCRNNLLRPFIWCIWCAWWVGCHHNCWSMYKIRFVPIQQSIQCGRLHSDSSTFSRLFMLATIQRKKKRKVRFSLFRFVVGDNEVDTSIFRCKIWVFFCSIGFIGSIKFKVLLMFCETEDNTCALDITKGAFNGETIFHCRQYQPWR